MHVILGGSFIKNVFNVNSAACNELTFQAQEKHQVMAESSSYCRLRQVMADELGFQKIEAI